MRSRRWIVMTVLGVIAPGSAVLLGGGCGSGGEESETPSSGSPEADRRAEMRVGASDEASRAPDKKAGDEDRTLYDRLGGGAGIARLVEDFTARVIADPRVNFERRDVKKNIFGTRVDAWDPTPENVERFKVHMTQFLALASGGPSEYTGQGMKSVHRGMRISNAQFDAMIGDVKTSMDRLGIDKREVKEVLAIMETTRKEIVEEQ